MSHQDRYVQLEISPDFQTQQILLSPTKKTEPLLGQTTIQYIAICTLVILVFLLTFMVLRNSKDNHGIGEDDQEDFYVASGSGDGSRPSKTTTIRPCGENDAFEVADILKNYFKVNSWTYPPGNPTDLKYKYSLSGFFSAEATPVPSEYAKEIIIECPWPSGVFMNCSITSAVTKKSYHAYGSAHMTIRVTLQITNNDEDPVKIVPSISKLNSVRYIGTIQPSLGCTDCEKLYEKTCVKKGLVELFRLDWGQKLKEDILDAIDCFGG